jgi:hypothetical protein
MNFMVLSVRIGSGSIGAYARYINIKTTVACNSLKDDACKFGVFQTVVICGLIDFSSFLLIVNIEVQLRLALFQQEHGE